MDIERLVGFGEVWAQKDLDACMAYFTEDAVFHAAAGPEPGTTYSGKDAIRRQIETIFGNPLIAPMIPGPCFISGDHGMAHWTLVIEDESGHSHEFRGVDFYRFEGDKIRLKDSFRKVLIAPN
jgi:ketosteroid isomerase-like protein